MTGRLRPSILPAFPSMFHFLVGAPFPTRFGLVSMHVPHTSSSIYKSTPWPLTHKPSLHVYKHLPTVLLYHYQLYIFKTYPPSRGAQPHPHFPLFASFYQVCICPLFSDAILCFVLILDFLLGSCFSYAIMSCQRSWYYYFLGFVLDWFISWHLRCWWNGTM